MSGDLPAIRPLRPGDGPPTGADLIYRSVLDSVASGVVSLDTRGVVTSFNAAAAEIVGLESEAIVGRTFAEVFGQMEGADQFADTILDAIYDTSMVRREVEATFAGKARTLSVATRYLKEEGGEGTARLGVVAVFTDITEIKELRVSELRLARELETQHSELLEAYRDLERTNLKLSRASKRIAAVRTGAALAVLVLFAAVGYWFWDSGAGTGRPARSVSAGAAPGGPADFSSVVVEPASVSSSVTLLARLAPLREIDVTSPVKGKVAAVHVRPGETVAKGQLLVEMNVAELQIDLREAQVAHIKARDRVVELEEWSDHRDVSRARRAVSKSSIALETARNRLAQTTFLLERGIIPASEHEAAGREHVSRRLDLESAEQDLAAILAKGAADLKVARLEFENATARLKNVEDNLSRARVTAPAAGVVMRPKKDDDGEGLGSGKTVERGDSLLTLGDFRGLTVLGQVDEVDVARLRPGQPAAIRGDAFPGLELRGRVVRVSSQAAAGADRRKAPFFEVAAAVDSLTEPQRLSVRLGMSATLEVVVYEKQDALLVPIRAVETRGGGARLLVRDRSSGEVRPVEVVTGITTLDSVEIVEGLAAGDEVLVARR